jgi:hypothetical protein
MLMVKNDTYLPSIGGMMLLCHISKIPYIHSEREKAKHHHCLGKDPQVPHMRDQKGS